MNEIIKVNFDEELTEYAEVINKVGIEFIHLIGEQLLKAKDRIIELTGDKRATGFIEWAERNFHFVKSTTARYIKAFQEKETDVKKIWGNEKSVSLTLPINTPELPEGKYAVIYIDPPWPVGSIVMDKWESPIADKYPTMTMDEIRELPVKDLAAEECALFLWTTHTFLHEALHLMETWGFKYFCLITWDKGGGWTQNGFHKRTELLLYGYAGKMNIDQYGEAIPTIIAEPKGKHSKKPDSIRAMIQRKVIGPKIELFAREKSEGWDAWGNEV